MAKSLSFNIRTRSVAVSWLMILATIIGIMPTAQAESDTHNPALGKHMPDILINKNVSAGAVGGRWRMRFDYSHFNYDGDNSHYNTNSYVYLLIDGHVEAVIGSKSMPSDSPLAKLPRLSSFYVGVDEEDDNRWWDYHSIVTESAYVRFGKAEQEDKDVYSTVEIIFKDNKIGQRHTVEFCGLWYYPGDVVYWFGPKNNDENADIDAEMRKWGIGYYTSDGKFHVNSRGTDFNIISDSDRTMMKTDQLNCAMPDNYGSAVKKEDGNVAYTNDARFVDLTGEAYSDVKIRVYNKKDKSLTHFSGTTSGVQCGDVPSTSRSLYIPDEYVISYTRMHTDTVTWYMDGNEEVIDYSSSPVKNASSSFTTGYYAPDYNYNNTIKYNNETGATTPEMASHGEYSLYTEDEVKKHTIYTKAFPRIKKDVEVSYDQWNQKLNLSWETEVYDNKNVDKSGKIVVYRVKSDGSYETLYTTNYADKGSCDITINSSDYGKEYKYAISFVPNNWDATKPYPDLMQEVSYTANPNFDLTLSGKREDASFNLTIDYTTLSTQATFEIYRTPYVSGRSENETIESMTKLATMVGQAGSYKATYVDDSIESNNSYYTYMVRTFLMSNNYQSNLITGTIGGTTHLFDLSAGRGESTSDVKVVWNVNHVGTADAQYKLERREYGSNAPWTEIYVVEGKQNVYRFTDSSAEVGKYYEYRVSLYVYNAEVNDYVAEGDVLTTDGFCQARGIVAGSITYDAGTGVPNAKVILTPDNLSEEESQFYAMMVEGKGCALTWENEKNENLFKDKDFSLQMYVRSPAEKERMTLAEIGDNLRISLIPDSASYIPALSYKEDGAWVDKSSKLKLPARKYSNFTLSHSGSDSWSMIIIGENGVISTDTITATIPLNDGALSLGGTHDLTGTFYGMIDDVRLWKKALTPSEVAANYNRLLSGNEANLALYWPLDEGIPSLDILYDYSQTSSAANNHHGKKKGACAPTSKLIPTEDQLSLYGLSNEYGAYEVRGIPFVGDGTTYVIRPVLNIHKFTPSRYSRIFSASSLNHNGLDFNDASSFPVSGQAWYENTNIPVVGASLMVDGVICYDGGKPVVTNSNGEFTIPVPIGNHYISIVKDGHTFVDGGRFPIDTVGAGTKFKFEEPITQLHFFDNTKVNIAGRVVGGSIEKDKDLCFGLSKANIGKARLRIGIEPTTGYHFNQKYVEEGTEWSIVNNPDYMPISNSNSHINSKAWYEGSSIEDPTTDFVVETDSISGEFFVEVPPLTYKVKSVEIIKNSDITFDPNDFPELKATNANVDNQTAVTHKIDDNNTETIHYAAAFNLAYFSDPTVEVTQVNRPDTWFGEDELEYHDQPSDTTITLTKAEHPNLFTRPVFEQGRNYVFAIRAFEKYYNFDNAKNNTDYSKAVTDTVHLAGCPIKIVNEMNAGVTYKLPEVENDPNWGNIVNVEEETPYMNDMGEYLYSWTAATPNINSDYTRKLNISISHEGKDIIWKWENEGTEEGMRGIVCGDLPSGKNFVTLGPETVSYILRDPGGSNSSATLAEGDTSTSSTSFSFKITHDTQDDFIKVKGLDVSLLVGEGVAKLKSFAATRTRTRSFDYIITDTEGGTFYKTIKTLNSISTSSNPDFVGALGDIYIGNSINYQMNDAMFVGPMKDGNDYIISTYQSMMVEPQEDFETEFIYTQYHILNTLIPQLKALRDNLFVEGDSKGCRYESSVGADNPDYCKEGFYKMTSPDNSTENGYTDMVNFYTTSIDNWYNIIAQNEKAKYEAINNRSNNLLGNYSFDGGSTVDYQEERTDNETYTHSNSLDLKFLFKQTYDLGTDDDKKRAVNFVVNLSRGLLSTVDHSDVDEHTNTIAFSLRDDDPYDTHTIDVFNAPDNFGPIFRTRGGMTSSPYEEEVQTEYYYPGFVISEATEQIDVPDISVEGNSLVTGVPKGSKAVFKVRLSTLTTTGQASYYVLKVDPSSNVNGAIISTPNGPIGDGLTYKLTPGSSIVETIYLEQGNIDIDTYDDIKLRLVAKGQSDPLSIYGSIEDSLLISAHFVQASSPVTLYIPTTVINTTSSQQMVNLEVSGYDYNYVNLEKLVAQYKLENNPTWSVIDEYYVQPGAGESALSPTGEFSINFDMSDQVLYPDGKYQFRVYSATTNGVTAESETIEVTKDVSRPQVLGVASPSDGILNYGDEISVTFNEDILSGAIHDTGIRVTGTLNGYLVDHAVALGAKSDISTLASTKDYINLAKKDFTINFWACRQGAGTLLTHGLGDDMLKVKVDGTGKIILAINGKEYTSASVMPTDSWSFVTMNYHYEEENPVVSMLVADANGEYQMFQGQSVGIYEGNGPLSVGCGIDASINELSLYDKEISNDEAQADMYVTKRKGTPDLIGYWKFDEGAGVVAADIARDRNMTLAAESWALNNTNLGVELDGNSPVCIDLSNVDQITSTDDFALDFWFRGDDTNVSKTIFATDNSQCFKLSATDTGLQLITNNKTYNIAAPCLDGAWHHFAINVLRDGNATIYVDGNALNTISAKQIEPLAAATLYFGGDATSATNSFKGNFDNIRLWNATLTGDFLVRNMYNRMSGTEAGLTLYFPFEKRTLEQGVVVTVGTDEAYVEGSDEVISKATLIGGTTIKITEEGPALREHNTSTNLLFDFVTDERTVAINLVEDNTRGQTKADLEGTIITFEIDGVQDLNGNTSQAVIWDAYVRCNQLLWLSSETDLKIAYGEGGSFKCVVTNKGGKTENWEITGMPSWLTASSVSGTLMPSSHEEITFTISKAIPVGRYEETIYLSGIDGIYEPHTLALYVEGDRPDWSVNPANYSMSMNTIGVLKFDGILSTDSDDMLAAFIDDQCVGVASPVYNDRYGTSYVMMTIYSNSKMSTTIKFKTYDASTGHICPLVTADPSFDFSSQHVKGSFNDPIIFSADDSVEVSIPINTGWTWMSLNVVPEGKDYTLQHIFGTDFDAIEVIKNARAFYVENYANTLKELDNESMYMVKSREAIVPSVIGKPCDPLTTPISIVKGWNWIGYPGQYPVSVNEAFAGIAPLDGEIVKGQSEFAIYTGYEWIGSLQSIEPCKGYIYQSNVNEDRTLYYPAVTSAQSMPIKAAEEEPETHYTPVDYHQFETNMIVIGKVEKGGDPINGIELGAFIDNQCRATYISGQDTQEGIVLLLIPGNGDDGKITFKAWDGEDEIVFRDRVQYYPNEVVGSLADPVIFNFDVTGIDGLRDRLTRIFAKGSEVVIRTDHVGGRLMVSDMTGKKMAERILTERETRLPLNAGVYTATYTAPDGVQTIVKLILK